MDQVPAHQYQGAGSGAASSAMPMQSARSQPVSAGVSMGPPAPARFSAQPSSASNASPGTAGAEEEVLQEMGFTDDRLNAHLLKNNRGDVQVVLEWLLDHRQYFEQ